MAENEMPAEQVRSVMTKNLEQAHGAIANYFQFVEKSISSFADRRDRSDEEPSETMSSGV